MKFREIKRRFRTETAFLNPVVIGIGAGAAVLLGTIFAVGIVGQPAFVYIPRVALPSFLNVLFQLLSYAALGAAFGILICMPLYAECSESLRLQKLWGLLLCACTLILFYLWTPVVCKAGSFFLGVLLCAMILLSLFVLCFLVRKISVIAVGILFLSAFWTLYMLYLTLMMLFFA